MAAQLKRRAITAGKYLLAGAVFFWLLGQVDLSTVAARLSTLAPSTIGIILLLTAVEFVARFTMWYGLLARLGAIGFRQAAQVDLVIKFVNTLLPSRVSGRVLSPAVIRQFTDLPWATAVGVSGAYTGAYAVIYGGVALLGLGLGIGRFSAGLAFVIGLSVALYLVAGVTILVAGAQLEWLHATLRPLRTRAHAVVPGILVHRLKDWTPDLEQFSTDSQGTFRQLLTSPAAMSLFAAGWAGALFIVPGTRVWLLLDHAGAAVAPLPVVAVFLVTAYSVTLLPITPGGLGVAEASATLVLTAVGVPASIAVSVVLIDRVLGVYLPSVLGAFPAAQVDLGGLTR